MAALALLVIVLVPDGRVTGPVAGGPTHVPALFLPSSLVFLFDLYAVASRLERLLRRGGATVTVVDPRVHDVGAVLHIASGP